jgi:hypothetical protein
MAVIMEPSMWHVSAIPWKAAYGPQVKRACVLNEKTMDLNKMEFRKGNRGYEACVSQQIRQKRNLKSSPYILRVN